MTKEQAETIAKLLRDQCMEELFPGVHAMVIKQRSAIKEVCLTLGVWESISCDLRKAKNMSFADQLGVYAAGLYESEYARPPIYTRALVAIMARYENGPLEFAKAVVLTGQAGTEEVVLTVGREIIDGMAQVMQREFPDCKIRTDWKNG